MEQFFPAIGFNITEEPALCGLCVQSVNRYFSLARTCRLTEEKIIKYCKHKETTNKGLIPRNRLLSISPKEMREDHLHMPTFQCKICQYKTNYRETFTRHLLVHNDMSGAEIFSCEICPFKTKYKHCLKKHMIFHRSKSGVIRYKCEICKYKTKHKAALKSHHMVHEYYSDTETYECNMCKYVTKSRQYFRKHLMSHGIKFNLLLLFKCDLYDF
ncbi:hypothetical protein NQ317_007899 [Molorchus minor]|uniref:C2H2-type domain-containing protein n=1 Tax=Molorchus minor TaxID=1323400 RepID=A0ABQ9JS70_9CUCU|nr:hypothetical protein NQ317_007899 [Molorchus minor]